MASIISWRAGLDGWVEDLLRRPRGIPIHRQARIHHGKAEIIVLAGGACGGWGGAVMTGGRRVDWPVHDDPDSGRRYFAVVADRGELADIVAVAPGRRTSLQRYFGIWFSKEP